MKYDNVGLLFVGLAVALLIFILFGHKRREHMSNEDSVWDNIRIALEEDMQKNYEFNVAEFRKGVLDQNKFFTVMTDTLQKFTQLIGVSIEAPTTAEVKNTNKLFDEKVKMLKKEYEKFVKAGDLENAESYRLAIVVIKSEARQYMIATVNDLKPKTFTSTISKIIG